MALATVSGTVSGLRERIENVGQADRGVQKISAHFRIGNRPVSINMAANIRDGDSVTAVGDDLPELRILVLRNNTTGVIYWPHPPKMAIVVGWVIIVLSFPLIFILVGFLTLPFGIYSVWKGKQIQKATDLLNTVR